MSGSQPLRPDPASTPAFVATRWKERFPPDEPTVWTLSPFPEALVVEVAVRGSADLELLSEEWDDLARHAAEPNVFYESWMMLSALEAYSGGLELRFLFVYETRDGTSPRLCGFFPLEMVPWFRGLPVRALRFWRYVHCFLTTPLVRAGAVDAVFDALFRWLRQESPRQALLEIPVWDSGGSLRRALEEFGQRRSQPIHSHRWERAFFLPRADEESYLAEALRPKKRKELRRLERRLAEAGRLELRIFHPGPGTPRDPGAARSWIEEFLQLEASGWKGRHGTALACSAADETFFRRVLTEAHARGRLMALALCLDGRAVAMKVNLLAGTGGFAFKIAHDEEFGRFSPGFLLEIKTIRHLHRRPEILWFDSCAAPDHPMIDRLWLERRSLESIVLATGAWRGRVVVPAFSLARRLVRGDERDVTVRTTKE